MTLTTEQLRARAKFWREKAVEAKWESVSIAQDMLLNAEAFEELAANREAQPVEWEMRFWNSGHGCWHEWERITAEQHAEMSVQHAADNDYEFRELYAEPPAPAVVEVLENLLSIVRSSRALPRRKEWVSGQQYSYVLLENVEAMIEDAFRAAMLTQPASYGYNLVPIELTDRMIDAFNETPPGTLSIEDLWRALLAAAPEGGN